MVVLGAIGVSLEVILDQVLRGSIPTGERPLDSCLI